MKAIMISIKPKWVAKILNGEKTIEIRKTMPKCDLPIDVYIYCTKDKEFELMFPTNFNNELNVYDRVVNGKVVAKFTLNKVEEIRFDDKEVQRKACLTEDELFDYLFVNEPYHEDMRKGYAWHISNLVIFDEPKELWEFETTKQHLVGVIGQTQPILQNDRLTKAPQSWCYIEGE